MNIKISDNLALTLSLDKHNTEVTQETERGPVRCATVQNDTLSPSVCDTATENFSFFFFLFF